MDTLPPPIRKLAQELLASSVGEDRSVRGDDADAHRAQRVCSVLRESLSRFAGTDGYSALMRRALALAAKDMPAVKAVKLGPECRMDGLEKLIADGEGDAAAVAIIGHLLSLLITFIGEALTLQLLREAWPDAPLDLRKPDNRD